MIGLSVLVIGGGIGGLSCAIALRQAGHDVHLVELNTGWQTYPTGITLQAHAYRAFDRIGVAQDVAARGYLHAYASVPEARVGIRRYIGFYNAVRPLSALGGRTPDRISAGDRKPVGDASQNRRRDCHWFARCRSGRDGDGSRAAN